MQKENDNLEFVHCVNFESIDSLKHNATKKLLCFDDHCEQICISKAFFDTAFGEGHRG